MKKVIIVFSFLACLLLSSPSVLAQGQIIPESNNSAGYCPEGYSGNCGNYEVNDFVELAVNVSQWILGVVGSLALVMFIYGGLSFMLSAGSSEKISQARKIIVAAIIGLIIVFASYLIIRFVLRSMGLDWNGKIAVPRVVKEMTLKSV